jgi:CheY-like chemotaxis protein
MHLSPPEPRLLVLIVEDETLVRMFLSDVLDEGFKVFEAVSADEALQVLQARPDVQVVISDIEMPGSMNGLGLAGEIRGRWPGVGVIVTSGRERPGPEDLPEEVAFLTKPYLPATVIDLIRHLATPQVIERASDVA